MAETRRMPAIHIQHLMRPVDEDAEGKSARGLSEVHWCSGPKNVVLESIRNVCRSSSLSRRKTASETWSLNLQQSQCWGSELTSNRVLVLESEREAAGLHCETIRILMKVFLLFLP